MKKFVKIIFSKKNLAIVGFLLLTSVANAQVMWNLKGGIARRTDSYVGGVGRKLEVYKGDKTIDWMADLEAEIPLNSMLNIETGLRYRNYNTMVIKENNGYDEPIYATTHFELPLRLTYKQQMGKYFSLHAGIGPYASYAIGDDLGEKWNNNLQVGLEPSVAINWACLSLGATYNIPCFYKGYKDENKPAVMLTLGIRFKSHVWKYVGATLLSIVTVGAAASSAWSAANSSSYNSSSYSPSYSSSSYGSSSSSSSSGGGSLSDQQSYNSDKRTYANYDSMLSSHFDGSRSATASEVKQWQQAMKNLRTKWSSKGKSFIQSSNETRSTSSCTNSSHSH